MQQDIAGQHATRAIVVTILQGIVPRVYATNVEKRDISRGTAEKIHWKLQKVTEVSTEGLIEGEDSEEDSEEGEEEEANRGQIKPPRPAQIKQLP